MTDQTTSPASTSAKPRIGGGQSTNVLVWQMVRKYWPTALATMLLVLIGTVFFTLSQKKIYEATGTVMFNPTPPRPLGRRVEQVVDLGAGSYWDNKEYYETQYHLVKSRRVALEVVEELSLHTDAAFLGNLPPDVESVEQKEVSAELAAEALRGRLEVQPVRDSRLATVTLRDADPARAQRLLAAVIDTYVRQNLETALSSTSSATDWLRNQLDVLKTDLESSERSLHDYKKENDILSVAFDAQSNMLAEEIRQINTELTRVRALRIEATARRSLLNSARGDDASLIQSTELLRSPLMNTLRSRYQEALRERDALFGSGKDKNHPDVAAAQKKVKASEKAILKEIRNIKKAVDRDVRVTERHAGGLNSMLKVAKERAHELNLLEIEFNRLRRSKENTEKLYSLVLERTKEADLTQMLRVNNISVVDRPLLPIGPVLPKIPLNLAVGFSFGLLLGVAAAFVRGLMDRTLKVPDDIEHELGVTFLGLLPELEQGSAPANPKKRRRGKRIHASKSELVVHEQPTSSIAEASRSIRTNLMFMSPDEPYRTLLVTSPGPSEGKTTVACCIAVAMAQTDQRVLLIDCDLRRPRVHRIFGRTSETGVTTVLLDGDIEAAITPTEVPNLSVLPAGPIPPNPAELFHAERFRKLIASATDRYDLVIMDSPPVAAVTDPAILSTLVDGTVVVARAFETRKEMARHALRTILDVGGKIVGMVLNAVDFSRLEYKYSYRYYRRDDYYRNDNDSPESVSNAKPSAPESRRKSA